MKVKRIIVKEGLILLTLVFIGTLAYLSVANMDHPFWSRDALWRNIVFGCFIVPFYILYSFTGFVIWTIKTLRAKWPLPTLNKSKRS